jgi:hypothetical protein
MSCSPRQCSRWLSLLSLVLICFAAVPFGQAQVQQASCTFSLFLLDRSSPSNPSFRGGTGVNDRKTVVGEAFLNYVQTPPFSKGFVHYFGGGSTYYSAPGAVQTRFNARNNNGVTVGTYKDASFADHSFVLQNATLTPIVHPNEKPNTTMVKGINKFNTTVGSFSSEPWGGTTRAFKRYSNGKFVSFSFPGSQRTEANGINDNGVIVGSYVSPGTVNGALAVNGFAYHNGQWATVAYPVTNADTTLLGISNAGVILAEVDSLGPPIYFMYANGVFKQIDVPNSSFTQVSGISAGGVISGTTDFNQGFTAICH